jgi:lipopolysaccharide biosynthesis regulator YciM
MVWLALACSCLVVVAGIILSERLRRRRDQAQAYLKGVRSMLSDDPDAAIEALSDAARLESPEAVETYLALGALFRRAGDLVRAVRLHRNMLLRPGILPARRKEIELELAEDYRRSGMLEQAGELYRALAAQGDRAGAIGLREVLVEQGDLAGAAEAQRRIGNEDPGKPDDLLAHLLAARAREEIAKDPAAARATAGEALVACADSADALLAYAQAEGAGGNVSAALDGLGRALERDPRSALLAWPALSAVNDSAAALAFIEARVEASPKDAALRLLQGRLLRQMERRADSLVPFRRALELDGRGEVTLAMRDLLREAEAPGPEELAARHDLLVVALLRKVRPLRCNRCGAETLTRAWRCRRCGLFDPYA